MSYLNKLRGKRAKADPGAVLQVSKAVIDTITPTTEQEPKAESLNRVTTITTLTQKASQTQVSLEKKYDKRSGFSFQGARAKTFGKTRSPWTLEDFRQHDCYPSISNGLLRLLKATGEPVTDAGIISAWEAAKDTIQAQLEARYAILTTWTEALLKKQGRVYLFMPETVAPKSGTISSGFSDPKELAAEVLRAEALGLWYELTRR